MLIKTMDGYKLAEHTVIYKKNNKTIEQAVGEEGKEWWLDFAEKWSDTEIIEFTDLHYTDEQLARLDEIKIMELSDNVLDEYVINGVAGESMGTFVLQKENENLRALLADLTEVVLLGGI